MSDECRLPPGQTLRVSLLLRPLLNRKYSRFPVAEIGALPSSEQFQGASVCGSVTVPGVASAARRARSRYALGSTPHSFADSIRL
jgi:hypothetical protein